MNKILVVEDESIIAMELEAHLTSMDYEVVGRASSGVEAIAKARELRPDLILMDIVMPGEKNGIEASEEIKSEMDVPIIFVTAYADEEFIKRAKTVEPFGYIVKPYEDRELRAAIEIALYKKEMEEARKRAEEKVKEAGRLREHFLKETSHRIITPVTIIGGCAQLLLESNNLDDAKKRKIRIMQARNEEVQKLVRDALAGKYLKEEEEGGDE
ncbi:PAS sensor protein [ANME-1 cluster archaeon GoMg4]|nr:PAS sensor protein [ANME-1 cluster archaeon GoMg4]